MTAVQTCALPIAPARLGALFPGVPLVIAGRFSGAPSGSLSVRGTASDGTPWEQHASGVVAEDAAATSIWARAHLRDLEDRYTVGGPDDLEQRIVATSLRFGVLCRFTAFVAVDSRVSTDGATPHQVVQPVEMPQGWGAPMAAPRVAHAAFMADEDVFDAPPAGGPPMPAAPGGPPPMVERAVPPSYGAPRPGAGRRPRAKVKPASPSRPVPEQTRGIPALTGFQQELTTVLDRLRQVPEARDERVHHLLRDLLPILGSVVLRMEEHGLDTTFLAALCEDLRRMEPTADEAIINAHWTHALQVLADFTGAPQPRRPFWKRPN